MFNTYFFSAISVLLQFISPEIFSFLERLKVHLFRLKIQKVGRIMVVVWLEEPINTV